VVLKDGWQEKLLALVHRCGGSTLKQMNSLYVSRLTANMTMSASTKTAPFYRDEGLRTRKACQEAGQAL
jgi:hypothetical protein